MKHSVKELVEFMLQVESKFCFGQRKVAGFYYWSAVRVDIYYYLSKVLGLYSDAHDSHSLNKCQFAKMVVATFGSQLLIPRRSIKGKALVVEHERPVKCEGGVDDIYTHYLKRVLSKQGGYSAIQKQYNGRHEKNIMLENVFYDDVVRIASKGVGVVFLRAVKKEFEYVFARLNGAFSTRFGVEINRRELFSVFDRKDLIVRYKYYLSFFRKSPPSELYVVVSYGNVDLIQAAKENQIRVVEIQHGIIGKYHLGYNTPGVQKDCLPDEIWVWDERVTMPDTFPSQVFVDEESFFAHRLSEYIGKKKEDKCVVVSQGAIGEQIFREVANRIDLLEVGKIIIKLHPGEIRRYKDYDSYSFLRSKGVEFVEGGDLYSLLSSSRAQVGVFSTALLEGMALGCETYLLNLPGIEYMDRYIESGVAKVLD